MAHLFLTRRPLYQRIFSMTTRYAAVVALVLRLLAVAAVSAALFSRWLRSASSPFGAIQQRGANRNPSLARGAELNASR